MIEDSGEPDEVNTLACETPVEQLPDECLGYLLGSRYCETDHLSGLAWSLFGHVPPGWARVQAICRLRAQPPVLRLRLCALHPHGGAGA